MATRPNTTNAPGDGDKTKLPVADWPIADLLDKYREHNAGLHTVAGILIGKHRFTKDQLPKLDKVRATSLVSPELVEKVKLAMAGRTVTVNQLDEFLFSNGIKPYAKTGLARKGLRTTGVIEVKENAAGTTSYIWLVGEKMGAPGSEELTVAEGE